MQYFCLIYPDAVHNGKATQIVSTLVQAGVKIVDRSIRRLSLEEARVIFYARRLDQDFDSFCKVLMISNVWLLHLEAIDLEKKIADSFQEEALGDFYIPSGEADNEAFLLLVTNSTDSKAKLASVIENVRTRLAEKQLQEDLEFSSYAVTHGQKMFSFYTAMQIAGFDKDQSFQMVMAAQPLFLMGRVLAPDAEEDEDDDDDESSGDDSNGGN